MTDSLSTPNHRLPLLDFAVIGAMKSGTTTLHGWLAEHADIVLASMKEPAFFSDDERWARGAAWYEGLFPEGAGLRGEASVALTDPRYARVAAARMAATIPDVRLVYLVRDPVERARSHYRHEVQRGRETRPLLEALRDAESVYLRTSCYWSCLEPYVERFAREQILVVRMEALTGADEAAWNSVLTHLGAGALPRPSTIRNVSSGKAGYTGAMRWLWERRLLPRTDRLPGPLRRLGRAVLLRDDDAYRALNEGSRTPIPADLLQAVWDDISQLENWLGVAEFWPTVSGG